MNSIAVSHPPSLPNNARRQALRLVPSARISGRTCIWSVLLGIGIITPLAASLSSLHLPMSPVAARFGQQMFIHALAKPGALFLKAVVIYPIIEEIFFRGLILQVLRRYSPASFAVAVSSLLFAATHLGQGPAGTLNALVLGAVFAGLVVRSGSLFPAMLCHSTVNFSWLFLILPAFGGWKRSSPPTSLMPCQSSQPWRFSRRGGWSPPSAS